MNDKQLFNIESDFLGLDFQNNFFKNPHDKYYSTVYKNYCELYVKYAYLSKKYSEIANSNIWKSTKKIRDFLDILKTFDNQRKSKIFNFIITNNYICHFVSFKKELLGDELFNSKCDGAQDFDIILRITEKTKKIAHIRKILYYWRASPESTAFSTDAKTYTTESARVALENHFKRMKQNALVLSKEKLMCFLFYMRIKILKMPYLKLLSV